MLYEEQLNIKIVDTIFDPDVYGSDLSPEDIKKRRPDIRYYLSEGSSLYKVWIFLSGTDLPRVDSVTYQLHETFDNPIRIIPRTLNNLDCSITIWTWGIFQINATILDKVGRSYSISHQMNYGETLKDYSDYIKYIQENPEVSSGATLIA